MPKTSPEQEKRWDWRRLPWLSRAPYFLGAILFHLILLLMLATLIIFRAPEHHDDATFAGVKIKVPRHRRRRSLRRGRGRQCTGARRDRDATATPASVIVSNAAQNFNMASTKVAMPNLPAPAHVTGSGLANTGMSGLGHGVGSVLRLRQQRAAMGSSATSTT